MGLDEEQTGGELSPWWRYGVLVVVLSEFAVLVWLSGHIYTAGPPMPEKVVDESGRAVFTGGDVVAGQAVFLKHALMDNGTIWGHGAYIGPDFSAEYLHQLALAVGEWEARERFHRPVADLSGEDREALEGRVHHLLATNRYDYQSGTLAFTEPEAASYRDQIGRWKAYFADSTVSRGLSAKAIADDEELRQLTAFFAWTAWASAARVPGKTYSYTNNFPYDPAIGNGPSGDAILWSALSLIALLAGTAAVLFAFGRFDYLGWRGKRPHLHPTLLPGTAGASQRATLKYFALVGLLFLCQVLVGGATSHFRADPKSFYGLNLSALLPSNLLRTWHLQLAIFWIATAFVGGGLFIGAVLGGREPKGQVLGTNLLFVALAVVIFGSLLGEFFGIWNFLGKAWFWFGHQGWEYLELGRAWQVLLVVGFLLWCVLLVRGAGPALARSEDREISTLFLLAAFAIPVFYLPAFFFGAASRFTVVDTWRFWIIHLWVEGFFELFATVMVAVLFYKLSMVSRKTALRVIYLDAILFLGSGIVGTGHHWYWTGQTNVSMALSAVFSAMEVVPLILLTLDAWDFVKLTRADCETCGKPIGLPHKWTFYFLIAVGVWNFIGAGIFGFLINLPVVSYYEAGTNLTANHGHAALMGVFGMLAVAMMVFALRQASTDEQWEGTQKLVRVSFWGLNIGLALMVVFTLFPTGALQLLDVARNGYWHARGPAFLNQPLIKSLEWLRLPADLLFILAGVVPLFVATIRTYRGARRVALS